MDARPEVEFVRRRHEMPSDPGTVQVQYALIGMRGAVSFTYGDWGSDATDEARAIDTEFVIRFGHTLFPQGRDLGYHSRQPLADYQKADEPFERECHLLSAPCWYEGSSLNGMNLMQEWVGAERDEEWLFGRLLLYYRMIFQDP